MKFKPTRKFAGAVFAAILTAAILNIEAIADGFTSSITTVNTLTVTNHLDVEHTATENDEHALGISLDAAGFGDIKALDIEYDTGTLATGEVEAVILVDINEIDANGGDIIGLEVLATDGGADNIYGMKAGAVVAPIIQDSGSFANPTTGTNNTASTDVADMIDGSTGTNTTIFVADDDFIIIGAAAAFTEIEFIIETPAGNPGIKPTFGYSITGSGNFTTFSPTDGTNGFRNTGVMAWDASDLTSHVVNSDTNTFDIKITRTHNVQGSVSLFYAKAAETVVYSWNKDGLLHVATASVDGLLTVSGVVSTDSTLRAGGDTAAGDNAAMGYTATEGLILAGQGTTNDITIKNDADSDVMLVPTGATLVHFPGAVSMDSTLDVGGASTLAGVTLAGAITGADNTVSAVNLKDYGEITSALGSLGGGTDDIDLTAGNVITATVDTSGQTFTFSNPTASDEGSSFTLILTNGGSQTVTWPGSVTWVTNGGSAPVLQSSGVDVLSFLTVDGGTIWYGYGSGRSRQLVFNSHAKIGAGAGAAVNAASDVAYLATVPASQTNSTIVIPISGLEVGETITAFSIVGQIESGANDVTVDANMRKHTAAAADPEDASIGSITQISKKADYLINDSVSSLSEVVANGETFYVLATVSTSSSTDVVILSVTVTVTED